MKILGLSIILLSCSGVSFSKETIFFKSADGLQIAADLYMAHPKSAPFIILFHQANWSRGEYLEIAPRLNSMGYNCMAVDLRSGGSINDVNNITKSNAVKDKKDTRYVDAMLDIEAALNYAQKNYADDQLIIWGSSYSASLCLKIAGDLANQIDAVIAFSPGEYFTSQGKPRDYITSSAINISQPAFITSAKSEKNSWWGMYVAIPSGKKHYYLPETTGNHGSRALWNKFSDSKGYWAAVSDFLTSI